MPYVLQTRAPVAVPSFVEVRAPEAPDLVPGSISTGLAQPSGVISTGVSQPLPSAPAPVAPPSGYIVTGPAYQSPAPLSASMGIPAPMTVPYTPPVPAPSYQIPTPPQIPQYEAAVAQPSGPVSSPYQPPVPFLAPFAPALLGIQAPVAPSTVQVRAPAAPAPATTRSRAPAAPDASAAPAAAAVQTTAAATRGGASRFSPGAGLPKSDGGYPPGDQTGYQFDLPQQPVAAASSVAAIALPLALIGALLLFK